MEKFLNKELAVRFVCTDELRRYMDRKGRRVISVEVAQSNASDFEVSELFLRLVTDDFARYLKDKKRYRGFPLEGGGEVLMPPYRLETEETVTFGREKKWIFPVLTIKGIHF